MATKRKQRTLPRVTVATGLVILHPGGSRRLRRPGAHFCRGRHPRSIAEPEWNGPPLFVPCSGSRAADVMYDVPGAKVDGQRVTLHPFATGPWRAPGAGQNVYARESQIDIMAAAAKIDPLDFRLRNLSDKRARRVLQAAADAFGWKAAAAPSGQGRAIAFSEDAGSYTALVAEVAVDKKTGERIAGSEPQTGTAPG